VIAIRSARPGDLDRLCDLRCALWPEGSADEHGRELAEFFSGSSRHALEVLVAEDAEGQLIGFCELSIRRYAEGCSTDNVGYLEGWYVIPSARRKGVGRALVEASEAWARAQGCVEFASDTEAGNHGSAAVHRRLGFTEVGLIRCFRKLLR